MTLVQAVFFDLDGTLLDDDASVKFSAEAACREFQSVLGVDPELVAEARFRAGKAFWNHRPAMGQGDGLDYRITLWQQALDESGVRVGGLASELARLYSALREKAVRPFEDAIPVIEALLDRDYRLAVITNGLSGVQCGKLKIAGLYEYFEAVIASSDFGTGKPNRVVFEAAIDALGADPAHTWHIGDNLVADVAGALNAGISAAWLNRSGDVRKLEHSEPHAEVRTLWELPSILTPLPRGER